MARQTKGPMGKFRGKVGTIVGSNYKGKQIIRSTPDVSNAKPTGGQMVVRARFSVASALIKPMTHLVAITFKERSANQTGYNAAVQYNLKNAVVGDYPDYTIDYLSVLVADGSLPRTIAIPIAADPAGGHLEICMDRQFRHRQC